MKMTARMKAMERVVEKEEMLWCCDIRLRCHEGHNMDLQTVFRFHRDVERFRHERIRETLAADKE